MSDEDIKTSGEAMNPCKPGVTGVTWSSQRDEWEFTVNRYTYQYDNKPSVFDIPPDIRKAIFDWISETVEDEA